MTEPGVITTFYSFKGGTGRTMALANVGWILAATGKRVLVIDWDLEAPGLHRYFFPFLSDPNFAETAGLLELLEDYVRLAQKPKREWPVGLTDPLDLADVRRHAVPAGYDFPDDACLHILAAGAQNATYAERLHRFEWHRFYGSFNGAEFIDRLGAYAREQYDHVLIDSRTGVADTSGITTLQLPDQLVLCFTYNRQSVEGIAAIGKTLLARKPRFRKILPVPMRVISQSKDIDQARDFAKGRVGFLLNAYPPREPETYWENAEIGHYADYGFAETLAAFAELPGRRQGLLADMLWLTAELTGASQSPVLKRIEQSVRERVLQRFSFTDPLRAQLAEIVAGSAHANSIAAMRELLALANRQRPDDLELWSEVAAGALELGQNADRKSKPEIALEATEVAVTLYRRLAEARPDAFLPDLTRGLNNLGKRLSDLGRPEEALAATEEAVAIRRRLAEARPDAFLPDLASGLVNLGIRLSALGRPEAVLAPTEEAVALYRRLAEARPDAFLHDLAMGLNNLGNALSALGRHEEGLKANEEAVALYRRLAEARPDAFLPDLAMGLNNLGNALSALGRHEEGLKATEEAVALYRRLAEARPDAFLPDLAMGLNNLGSDLSALDCPEEALAANEEATAFYRRLAEARPDAFLPNLAMSLSNLADRHDEMGEVERAIGFDVEAIRAISGPFLALPAAHAWLTRLYVRDYVSRCQKLGIEPDAELLGPITEILQRLEAEPDEG